MSETLIIALVATVATIIGSLLTFHVARRRLELEWKKEQSGLAAKFQQIALTETLERERLEIKLEAEIAKLQFDRDSLRERLMTLQDEYEDAKRAWEDERASLLAAMTDERERWTRERAEMQVEIKTLQSEVEVLKEKTGPLKGRPA